ncbi:MAG TPA: hypothetical protein VKG23_11160 [Thermoanaerobaculia bacterium]|nr:hypothetical protein [Thermoanaerobaculia bacterium]
MTTRRKTKRIAYTWIGMGLILLAVIALTGAGRREPVRLGSARPSLSSPGAEVTPGIAQADVDTLDLQLD